MTLGMFTTSCKDMLTPDSERHSYEVAQDTLYSYWGILRSLQNVAERYVILNECRSDLVDGTTFTSDTINAILNFGLNTDKEKFYKDGACAYLKVSDFYHIINSCNAYLDKCDKDRRTGTNKVYMLKEYSQVLAIRAWVYMQLVYAYGEVPFYTKPMLTTDAINQFMGDPNHETANIQNLADKLAPELEGIYYQVAAESDARHFNTQLPQYNNYGDANTGSGNYICHSTKMMFPLPIILGDLYLMQGDATACQKSANWYYQYLNTDICGPIRAGEYYCEGDIMDGEDEPIYSIVEHPFRETGAVARSLEGITCIPSNKGKLDGKVNTDISRLFGFEPTIRVNGSGDDATSSVSLSLNFDRELVPSKGYEAIGHAQDYEIYIGDNADPYRDIVALEGVGDARMAWIYNMRGSQWVFHKGDDVLYGKMVSKQNYGGSFCPTYPMVYRKSTIWLRYAEALNRAGFPTYAFAILKSGLCNNDQWFPSVLSMDTEETYKYTTNPEGRGRIWAPETIGYFYRANTPEGIIAIYKNKEADEEGNVTVTYFDSVEEIEENIDDILQKYADAYNEALLAEDPEADEFIPEPYDVEAVWCTNLTFKNYTTSLCGNVCYYLSKEEIEAAATTPYLNFNTEYMKSNRLSILLTYKTYPKNKSFGMKSYTVAGAGREDYVSMGIHQRGCGFIMTDDLPTTETGKRSSFNYVELIKKSIKDNYNEEWTEDQIYASRFDNRVQEAVEDLIVNEMAMELAFEGTRFSDLCRVATRRGDADYLAKRVAMRGGTENAALHSYLKNKKNWYLPFPVE